MRWFTSPVRLFTGSPVAFPVAAAAVVAAFSVARLTGQTPAQPRFKSGVDVIEVTLLARDGSGRLVTDLKPSELQIVESGTPQSIVAFQRVILPAPPAAAATAPAAVARDVATNERVADGRIFVLVLDSIHVAGARTRAVRRFARQFVEQHVGAEDMVAVMSPGALAAATQDFTSDKARLLAAIDGFTGSKMTSAIVERDQERRMAALGGGMNPHNGRDPSDAARADAAVSLHRVLEAIASHLERIPGRRKSLLLFSEGIDYDLGDVGGRVQQHGSDVRWATSHAIDALMRTNVSVYAIDPRALYSAESDLLESPLFEPAEDASIAKRTFADEQQDSIRSLQAVSEATGGFAAVNRNDFSSAYARIVEESGAYYVLGYVSSKPPKPGEFRSIEVKTTRPGVKVIARRGYIAPRPQTRASAASEPAAPAVSGPFATPTRPPGRGMAAPSVETPAASSSRRGPSPELSLLLSSPLPQPGLPLRVQAIPFRGDGKKADVELIVEIIGKSLTFTERGDRFDERIDLAMVTVDESGRAGNGRSTAVDLHLPADEYQRVKTTGVRWLSRLELQPGRYQIRIAARAAGTGATGMLTHDVVVPRFEANRVGLSAVTLTSLPAQLMSTRGKAWLESTLKSPPSAARVFVQGDQIVAALEVYAPKSAREGAALLARVERTDGAIVQTLQRIATEGTPAEESGFAIDTRPLAPASYLLRIIASSGGDTQERLVPFDIVGR